MTSRPAPHPAGPHLDGRVVAEHLETDVAQRLALHPETEWGVQQYSSAAVGHTIIASCSLVYREDEGILPPVKMRVSCLSPQSICPPVDPPPHLQRKAREAKEHDVAQRAVSDLVNEHLYARGARRKGSIMKSG